MMREIRKVAVLGAGTMGSRIAAHFANAGVDWLLLDVPVTNASGLARNGIAEQALKKLQKERIPPFFSLENANKIEVGNFADDLDRLGGVDWILEAVTEDFEIKRSHGTSKITSEMALSPKIGTVLKCVLERKCYSILTFTNDRKAHLILSSCTNQGALSPRKVVNDIIGCS